MKGNWFVLWVLTGHERDVLAELQETPGILEALVPMEQLWYRREGAWEQRPSVAIPGYVFLRCDMDTSIYHRICGVHKLPHVIGWLGSDSMWPTIVPEQEMLPVIELNAGCDPASQLQDVAIDRRKRRGRGTLTLYGQAKTIVFTPRTNEKQPENERVDQRPATDEGDQSPQETTEGEA